jgi:hypothetical protein
VWALPVLLQLLFLPLVDRTAPQVFILPDAASKCAPGDAPNRRDAPAPPAVDRSDRIHMACNVDERIEPILKPDARGVAEYATRIAERLPGSTNA